MPPKKAAKKHSAKHAPKKAAKKHAPAESSLKDTLRTYEHLGRVRLLLPLLAADDAQTVTDLGNLAHAALEVGAARDSADLLRAAEHFCFGALDAREPRDTTVSPHLKSRIRMEYNHLRERGDESSPDMPQLLSGIYRQMAQASARAFSAGSYRSALEMARGAEALTHVEGWAMALAQQVMSGRSLTPGRRRR